MLHLAHNGLPVEVAELDTVGRNHCQIAVREEEKIAGVIQNRGHVGSHEIFVFPQTNHGRWSIARCHDLIRLVHRNDRQRKHTGYVSHRLAHRFLQRWPVTIAWVEEIFFDQMGDDLSIRFGGELVAFLDQLLFEAEIVLHNPIVHDHNFPGAIAVRMRILFRGPPVRSPSCVADSGVPLRRVGRDDRGEVVELALRAHDLESAVLLHRDARRVVAAVLEPAQPIHQERERLPRTDVADDAAHG